MKLDRFQREEFVQHWAQSYMLHNEEVVYVTENYARDSAQVEVHKYKKENIRIGREVEREREVVRVDELEPFDILRKYVQIDHNKCIHFTRSPRQQVRRGINGRNVQISFLSDINGRGELVFSSVNLTPDHVVYAYHDLSAIEINPKMIADRFGDINNPLRSVALSPSLALIRRSGDYVPLLVCNNTPIGYFDGERLNIPTSKIVFKEVAEMQKLFPVRIAA